MEHYYSEYQNSRLDLKKISAVIRGKEFEFYTSSGIFSKNRIDKGTELLAENVIINDGDVVLDVGCGIGVLGIVIAKSFPKTKVIITDINRRAIDLARSNIKLNRINNIDIVHGDLFVQIKEKFNVIVVNPPMKAGYKICFEIIESSKNLLFQNGKLQLVALHNKGGKRLSKKMSEIFGDVNEITKKSGYRVYVSEVQNHLAL